MAALGLAAVAAASVARGENLKGSFQVQFLESRQAAVDSAGGPRRWRGSSYWSTLLNVDYAASLGRRIDLVSQLEFRRLAYNASREETVQPRGTLRLSHPFFGLFGNHRPSRVTDGGGQVNSQRETMLTGYLARPGLPHLDASWIRRRQESGPRVVESTATTRTLRASHDLGPVSVRGGWADQTREPADRRHLTVQTNYDAGVSCRFAPRPALYLTAQYDFNGGSTRQSNYAFRSGGDPGTARADSLASTERTTNRLHSGQVAGTLRASRRTDLSLNYNYRRSETRARESSRQDDHDGALMLNYTPSRGTRLSAGGGVRTVRQPESPDLVGNLLLLATANGRVRPGWTGGSSVARSANWIPGGRRYFVDTFRGGSVLTLTRGLDLNGDLQVTANGDTASRDLRLVTLGSVGVAAVPLRNLRITWSDRIYRAGPSLGRAASRSTSVFWDVRWRAGRGLELGGNVARTGAQPRNEPRSTTTQLNARWAPSGGLQMDLNYARSSQTRLGGTAGTQSGTEIATARLLAALGRSTRLNAGFSVANPGRAGENRQVDVTLTRVFGR